MTTAKPGKTIADIELLRGIAVVMVLLFHLRLYLITWPVPWWDHLCGYVNFWSGVDIFFAISGFVIGRSLLPQLDAGIAQGQPGRATLAFLVRRAWRILPSAWLWLALILLQSVIFNRSRAMADFHTNFQAAIAGFLSIANFRGDNLNWVTPYGGSPHYWSLSFEEQFYAVFPAAAILGRRHLLALLIATALVFALFLPHVLYCRPQAMILGILIAIAAANGHLPAIKPATSAQHRAGIAIIFTAAMICICALTAAGQHIATQQTGPIAVLAALLVLLAQYDRDYIPIFGNARRIMLWVGSRSYTIYLVHMPVYYGAREFWLRAAPATAPPGPGWELIFLATALPILALLAEANFRLIENPLRRHGASIARQIWPPAQGLVPS